MIIKKFIRLRYVCLGPPNRWSCQLLLTYFGAFKAFSKTPHYKPFHIPSKRGIWNVKESWDDQTLENDQRSTINAVISFVLFSLNSFFSIIYLFLFFLFLGGFFVLLNRFSQCSFKYKKSSFETGKSNVNRKKETQKIKINHKENLVETLNDGRVLFNFILFKYSFDNEL